MDCSSTCRRALTTLALVGLLVTSGCLTTGTTVTADTSDSPVFKSFSTSESWSGNEVPTKVTLTADATTEKGVTKLVVISKSGSSLFTTTVEPGTTSTTVFLPVNEPSTVVAVNTVNGTVVDEQQVKAGGDKLF